MRPQDYTYHAPAELIAQQPLKQRGASRLLHLPAAGGLHDRQFADLPRLLGPADLAVVNDTAVLPARLFGYKSSQQPPNADPQATMEQAHPAQEQAHPPWERGHAALEKALPPPFQPVPYKESGAKVELLLERMLDPNRALVQLRANRAPRAGQELVFEGGARARVTGRQDAFFVLEFNCELVPHLQRNGHVPLPPYIRRADQPADREDYQTIFARHSGAVAAPTAGLHFQEALLRALEEKGVGLARITLHVGAGTFKPVGQEQVRRAELHSEFLHVSGKACRKVRECRERGGRVCAVGTTVTRALETAARHGELQPFKGETRLFIMPGFEFRVVDLLVTNFHLPESSLLMLVCAFAGREPVLNAYRHAVRQRYRLFSYGDAMLLERREAAG